jgi:septal ring factor EnvC (AmiA/AmiB activator)
MKRAGFCLLFVCFVCFVFGMPKFASADSASDIQSQIDANNQQITSLEADIAEDQQQLTALGTEKSTLQSTISSLTLSQKQIATQIQITQNKIASANLQIQQLTLSIGDKETAIAADQDAISDALRSVDEGEQTPLITGLISANSLSDAWQSADEDAQFNQALMNNISDLNTARTKLATNRDSVTKRRRFSCLLKRN